MVQCAAVLHPIPFSSVPSHIAEQHAELPVAGTRPTLCWCWVALPVLLQVMVAEIDSHKAFRLVSELKALAVLLREGVPIPAPYQLAASLKQQKSWDDK